MESQQEQEQEKQKLNDEPQNEEQNNNDNSNNNEINENDNKEEQSDTPIQNEDNKSEKQNIEPVIQETPDEITILKDKINELTLQNSQLEDKIAKIKLTIPKIRSKFELEINRKDIKYNALQTSVEQKVNELNTKIKEYEQMIEKLKFNITKYRKEKMDQDNVILKQEEKITELTEQINRHEKHLRKKNEQMKQNELYSIQLVKIVNELWKKFSALENQSSPKLETQERIDFNKFKQNLFFPHEQHARANSNISSSYNEFRRIINNINIPDTEIAKYLNEYTDNVIIAAERYFQSKYNTPELTLQYIYSQTFRKTHTFSFLARVDELFSQVSMDMPNLPHYKLLFQNGMEITKEMAASFKCIGALDIKNNSLIYVQPL
jgi:hypothetical protein